MLVILKFCSRHLTADNFIVVSFHKFLSFEFVVHLNRNVDISFVTRQIGKRRGVDLLIHGEVGFSLCVLHRAECKRCQVVIIHHQVPRLIRQELMRQRVGRTITALVHVHSLHHILLYNVIQSYVSIFGEVVLHAVPWFAVFISLGCDGLSVLLTSVLLPHDSLARRHVVLDVQQNARIDNFLPVLVELFLYLHFDRSPLYVNVTFFFLCLVAV